MRFILPFGAGSASDTTARLFAERLSARWGKPVVVENRPGGDGLVSLDAFVGAHDDHTMWFGPACAFNVLPYQHDTLPFDLKRDLNPVVSVSQVVLAISMPASMNVNSIDQLVTMARAQPGKLNAAAANRISDFLLARAAYHRRRSSNANGLRGQNSAGFPQISATFQRDNLRQHF